MVDFKYTKIQKIYEVNNDMCHNYYYLYYGRIYNKEHTKYKKFKYVEWFDIFDIQEYYEKDWISQEDVNNYAHEIENGYLMNIKNYDDVENLKKFYEYCNDTIRNYNKI